MNVIIGTWASTPLLQDNIVRLNYNHQSVSRNGIEVRMQWEQFKLAGLLITAQGNLITYTDLWWMLWGDREDGGPESVYNLVGVRVSFLRKVLAPLNIVIVTRWGHGLQAEDYNPNSPSPRGYSRKMPR